MNCISQPRIGRIRTDIELHILRGHLYLYFFDLYTVLELAYQLTDSSPSCFCATYNQFLYYWDSDLFELNVGVLSCVITFPQLLN